MNKSVTNWEVHQRRMYKLGHLSPWKINLLKKEMFRFEPVQYLSFEDARDYVRKLKLKNHSEWKNFVNSDKFPINIPRSVEEVYKDKGWTNIADWLGCEPYYTLVEWENFDAAREFAQSLNFKRTSDWFGYCKLKSKPKNIPARPHSVYKDGGWINYSDWLGYSEHRFLSLEESTKYMHSVGLKSYQEWNVWKNSSECPKNIPKNPHFLYNKLPTWNGLPEWLGYVRKTKHWKR